MAAKLAIIAGALLLVAALVTGIVLGSRDSADERTRIVLATAIDAETGAPLDSLDRVQAGTTELYATLAVEDVPAGVTFSFDWSHRESGAGFARGMFAFSGLEVDEPIDDGWIYTRLEIPEGLPSGEDYAIEVKRDGRRIAVRRFDVTE